MARLTRSAQLLHAHYSRKLIQDNEGFLRFRSLTFLRVAQECASIEWDDGNSEKNWIKHQVSRAECEELFFNEPLVAAHDKKHSEGELRYYVLGQTDEGRRLFVVVTIRDKLIRVISARDMSRREEKEYKGAETEEGNEEDTEV